MRKSTILFIIACLFAALAVITSMRANAATTCTQTYAGPGSPGQYGQCQYPPYYLENDVWNPVAGSEQVLTATSASSWSVTAHEPAGHCGTDYVCAYPEDVENFPGDPISTLNTVQQVFTLSHEPAHSGAGAWEVAADDWLNGAPGGPSSSNQIEVMVWENTYQVSPGGSPTGKTLTIDGETYQIWQHPGINGDYIALVSETNLTSGTIHMATILHDLVSLGFVANTDKLVQLDMGEEITSTNGAQAIWTYSAYHNNVVVNS
jgi:hypothetical protein